MNKIARTLIAFPLLMSILASLASYFEIFDNLDTFFFDRAHHFARFKPSQDILIVAIDEQSFDALGAWPWSRHHHADLVNNLAELGADYIVFDILFSEMGSDLDADLAFADAIQKHGNVVLPLFIDQIRQNGPVIEIPPAPLFSSVAASLGHVHIECDDNGVCRSVYLKEGVGDAYWPHVSAALASLQTPSITLSGERPQTIENHSPKLIYRDYHNYLLFPDYRPLYKTVSYVDIIEGRLKDISLKGSSVFIGASSKGLNDMILTPTGSIPGVVANAMIYQTLKQDKWITAVPTLLCSVITFFVGFLFLLYFSRLSPLTFLVSVVLMLCLVLVSTFLLINGLRLWFSASALFILLIVYYPLWSWFRLHLALSYLKRYQSNLNLEKDNKNSLFSVKGAKGENSEFIKNEKHSKSLEVVTDTIRNLNQLSKVVKENQFIIDQTLSKLQEAVVVTDTQGRVSLSNALANRFFDFTQASFFNELKDKFTLTDNNDCRDWQETFASIVATGKQTTAEIENSSEIEVESEQSQRGTLPSRANQLEPTILLCHVRRENYQSQSNDNNRDDDNTYDSLIIFTFTDITRVKMIERSRIDTLRFLSHDLRSPMVSALALIESIRSGNNNDDQNTNLNKLENYARKNLRYSEKIIQASRAEELDEKTFELCDLHAVVDTAYGNCLDFSKSQDISLSIEREDEDFWVMGDMDALVRATENLISNAIKYSNTHTNIRVYLSLQEGHARISVIDNGPGLTEEEQSKIFGRFQKASTKTTNTGVGLGLYYVQTVTQKHEGRIELTSRPGEGSTFSIIIPLSTMPL